MKNRFSRRCKTDQEGESYVVKIARGQTPLTCPIKALREWLNFTTIIEGPVFRRVRKNGSIGESLSDWAVWHIIKARMKALGLKNWDEFAGHSVRSGFASTAANNGASIQGIKTQGNWKSDDSVMRYIRNNEDWGNAASYELGVQGKQSFPSRPFSPTATPCGAACGNLHLVIKPMVILDDKAVCIV